jgi:hypothetical protein
VGGSFHARIALEIGYAFKSKECLVRTQNTQQVLSSCKCIFTESYMKLYTQMLQWKVGILKNLAM